MQIYQVIDKINDNQIFVPAFQREYVWKRKNVKALFTSLIKKRPTGTLLTWDTTNPPELKGEKKYSSEMGAVKLLLDGQQRVTTIYMIHQGKLPPYYSQREIRNDVFNLYVNLETLELEYYKKFAMQHNPFWVNLTEIFQKKKTSYDVRNALREQGKLSEDIEKLIDENFESIKSVSDREFPEQIIPIGTSIREAIDIFYIVNAGGVNLTEAELALAQISGYWPEARELFKAKLLELEEHGFAFRLDFIIYALLGVTHYMGSDLRRLHSDDNLQTIKHAWDRLDHQILGYVVNVLRDHAFVDHLGEINSDFALIPMITAIFKKPNGQLTEVEVKKAVKWFYYSQLRQRYTGQVPQKLDQDLAIVKNSSSPFDDLLGVIEQERSLDIEEKEFNGRDIRHPLFSLMRWYFKSKSATCLTSGVSIRQNMGKDYSLKNDHIFPYTVLKKHGYDTNNRLKYALAQELTNRAILAKVENRDKSDQVAEKYLKKARSQFPSALSKQCIPEDETLWELNSFEKFLAERRRILSAELNEFLRSITETDPAKVEVSIADMIDEGEHDSLEFKSSLRWDVDNGGLNKKLEKNVLKSIAAFNNGDGDGGTLIIGVDREGKVLGLENDLSTLNEDDVDAYERHLFQIVKTAFGDYAASKLKVRFHEILGSSQKVCEVIISRGVKPLLMQVEDKKGRKSMVLYVRMGNSSQPITEQIKMSDYIGMRFQGA